MAARRRSLVRIVLAWAFLTLAWCAFVIVLAGRLHAQPVGCYVIDRFQQLCVPSTGEIFVDVAGGSLLPLGAPWLALRVTPIRVTSHAAGLEPAPRMIGPRVSAFHAAATPRIILARQEFARTFLTAPGVSGYTLVHDGYTQWTQPHRPGTSCCNNQDCSPVDARRDEQRGVYQAFIDGQWRDIPTHIVLDPRKPENHNPDGSFHACWNRSTGELLCFREAEPKI